jgi:predicted dehydrogenase
MAMNKITRRSAMQSTTMLAVSAATSFVHAEDANPRPLRAAMIGGSRGLSVAKEFRSAGFEIGIVCDVDDSRRARAQQELGAKIDHSDLRRVIDDDSIDAVIVATPDHWHAPAAILALDAGKHVYVEKPCAHNIREGRALINAAKRSGKVVQVGTQTRSTPTPQKAIRRLHEGAIGDVKIARVWNSQRRANIGHKQPSVVPKGFDYDSWVGPAPKPPFQSNRHHYTWHWWYDFGTGDAGNDGVHELDVATWGLNVKTHPTIASGHGSKLYFDDDQQFPDTQHVTFEYPDPRGDERKKKVLVFENRIWTPYGEQGIENGVGFYGTDGYMIFEKKGGYRIYGPKGELREQESGEFSTLDHATNFASAIREGIAVNAPPAAGHLGASLAHLANIIGRTGLSTLRFDPAREQIVGNDEANQYVGRTYRHGHWAVPDFA